MPDTGHTKQILVLLIGEVLEDPRVYKTCLSLSGLGADVTVACTNPSHRPADETHRKLKIVRFPHPREYILKKLYHYLQGKLSQGAGAMLAEMREVTGALSMKSVVRNAVLNRNAVHAMNAVRRVNRMMADVFAGSSFDLVHCNDVDTLAAGSELRRSGAACEMLYDAHEYWAGMGIEGSRSNRMNRESEAAGIKSAEYVVTVNPMIAGLLREQYDLSMTPAVVMNCPYRYDGPVSTDTAGSPVRIVFQGKMQAYRGLEKLILAFRHIDGGVLTMSGYGPLAERLQSLARTENLSNRVTFTGRYDPGASTALLSGHDIGVITYERTVRNNELSSPNKLFEYAMAGCAVAASGMPFIAEVVDGHGMGMLFGDITPESIAETLNEMIADTERLKTFKKNARTAAVERFEWNAQFAANYPWTLDE